MSVVPAICAWGARFYNGTVVQPRFGQAEEPLKSVLNKDTRTAKGICRHLVYKWMKEKVAGREFWDWLTPNGDLDTSAVSELMVLFIKHGYDSVLGNAVSDEDFLDLYGLVQVTNFAPGGNNTTQNTVSGRVPAAIGDMLQNNVPQQPAAAFFSLVQSTAGGHAVGAWNAGNALHFYDPNIGEIRFPGVNDAAGWLENVVGKIAYKSYTYVKCDWYE